MREQLHVTLTRMPRYNFNILNKFEGLGKRSRRMEIIKILDEIISNK